MGFDTDGRAKRRVRFIKVVRAALVGLQRRLHEVASASAPEESQWTDKELSAENFVSVSSVEVSQPQVHPRDVESKSPRKRMPPLSILKNERDVCPGQWNGAGKELREILHRRWNATQ